MKYVVMFLVLAALAGCESLGKPLPPPPTVAEIVDMAKGGQSADAIIQRMQESRAVYRSSASELAKLREQGVPDKVIDYMLQTYVDAVRYWEWARARDAYLFPMFPGSPFYPYFGRYPFYGW